MRYPKFRAPTSVRWLRRHRSRLQDPHRFPLQAVGHVLDRTRRQRDPGFALLPFQRPLRGLLGGAARLINDSSPLLRRAPITGPAHPARHPRAPAAEHPRPASPHTPGGPRRRGRPPAITRPGIVSHPGEPRRRGRLRRSPDRASPHTPRISRTRRPSRSPTGVASHPGNSPERQPPPITEPGIASHPSEPRGQGNLRDHPCIASHRQRSHPPAVTKPLSHHTPRTAFLITRSSHSCPSDHHGQLVSRRQRQRF